MLSCFSLALFDDAMGWGIMVMQAALDLFEATWDNLIGMPSRQSAADEAEVRLLLKTAAHTQCVSSLKPVSCADLALCRIRSHRQSSDGVEQC